MRTGAYWLKMRARLLDGVGRHPGQACVGKLDALDAKVVEARLVDEVHADGIAIEVHDPIANQPDCRRTRCVVVRQSASTRENYIRNERDSRLGKFGTPSNSAVEKLRMVVIALPAVILSGCLALNLVALIRWLFVGGPSPPHYLSLSGVLLINFPAGFSSVELPFGYC